MLLELNVTSGWFSESNSGPRTCARNWAGLWIEIDSTFAAPSSARPSSPAVRVAVTSSSVPRNLPLPEYSTAKPNEE